MAPATCACVGVCPHCEGSGTRHGGRELCACRVARERIAALAALDLAWPDDMSAEPDAWFARYRPEDDWPWLFAVGRAEALSVGVARLVTGIGVPVDVATDLAQRHRWRRLVFAPDLASLGTDAALLVDHCAREGLTLVASARVAPFPSSGGPGLEAVIGENAALALYEHGEVR